MKHMTNTQIDEINRLLTDHREALTAFWMKRFITECGLDTMGAVWSRDCSCGDGRWRNCYTHQKQAKEREGVLTGTLSFVFGGNHALSL